MKNKADIIFYDGSVITVNNRNEICSSIAVKDNKILDVGTDDYIREYESDKTKTFYLDGRTVVPGFIDAHMHFTEICMIESGIIIPIRHVKSIDEIKEIIYEEVKRKKPGEWILLTGYDHNKLKEKRHPTIRELDEAAPDNPLQCQRICNHMSVFNSAALKKAGIDKNTEFKRPDEVDIDEYGNLTGLFKSASQYMITDDVSISGEIYEKSFSIGERLMHKNGITSIHDMGAGMSNTGRNIMQDEILSGKLKLRAYMTFCSLASRDKGLKALDNMVELGPHTGIGNEWYKMGPVKLLLDGSTSGPSSYMKAPYSHDKKLKGIQNFKSQKELNDALFKAYKEGFQITAHAVGDGAVEQIVTAYEFIREKSDAKEFSGRRMRIEHSGFTNEDLIERMKNLSVVVISNPAFITINGSDYIRYYGERTEKMFAHRSYQNSGIREGFGSDCPVSYPNPMHGIYGAVMRKDIKRGDVCGQSQKIDILDAVRCYTYNNAYASFEENIKGSLEKGKLADIAVLSDNILNCDKEHIKDIEIDMTMIDGKFVYLK